MGLNRVSCIGRYQGQCRALQPLGHQGYRLRSYKKDPPLCSGYICRLGVLCCLCRDLGHLAHVHRCARSVLCFARAMSWATWHLFTGAPARCVVLRVRCPGPLGSCSPVCPLGVLFCVCAVLCHLAPVHRCARWLGCFECAVSGATWRLFTGVPARCVALLAPCPRPLGSWLPVRPLGGLCCACGVLGPFGFCSPVCLLCGFGCVYGVLDRLALVHRCARSVCCAVGCACSVACVGRRCGALTRPSGQRLFVAGRGWVPSGRASVHLDGGWCCLAPVPVPWFGACCARSLGLRHPAAVAAWHLSVSLGCGRRRASLACLVAPRGAPHLVRSGRSRCSGRLSLTPWCLSRPRGLAPPALLRGCAGHTEAGREPG